MSLRLCKRHSLYILKKRISILVLNFMTLNQTIQQIPISLKSSSLLLFIQFFLSTTIIAQKALDFDKDKLLDEIAKQVTAHFYETDFDTTAWNQRVYNCRQRLAKVTRLDQFDFEVNELLGTLNTSHTYFFSRNNPKRYQLLGVFNKLFDENDISLFCYDGIGIETKTVDGKVFIIAVYDGLPAAKAGLQFGDQIVSVDKDAFHPIESFRSKADSNVTVEFIRDQHLYTIKVPVAVLDGRTMFETALQSSIQIINRNGKNIGYLHLWSYAGSKYQEQLREAILWGKLSQCDALIVDLRDGWGGADINNLNLFRKPIAIIQSTSRDGLMGSYSGVWEKPVALLTNGKSTSGKELFAYGFKKLKLGNIIGEKTAGAVVAGRIFKLSSGDLLYLAVRDVLVDGKRLEGVGVKPDVLVERPIESGDNDPQLERALEELSH